MKKKLKQLSLGIYAMAMMCGCTAAAADTLTEKNIEKTAVEAEETAEAVVKTEPETVSYDQSETHEAVALGSDEEIIGGTYTADETDESVMDITDGASVSITGALLEKVSGEASDVDDASFKGLNAAVRVYDGASAVIKNCTINAAAKNATGVFAYDTGVVEISDSEITVTGGGAGGIQVAGGGTLYASNLTVTSSSKAAIRSDRGGGVMVIDGGTYTSLGKNGCPSIYSTADITVKNAECISENSRAVIIEGKNSVTLENCNLYGNDQSDKEGSVKANVLLYQSASGDASEGTSVFTMTGGSMTSYSGAMFYCTNTSSTVTLEDTDLVLSEDDVLLIVSEGRWGKEGSNGGYCVFNAKDQELNGDIIVDSISSLTLNMTASSYEGMIDGNGDVSVTLDENSTWTLTGDSYVSSFEGDLSDVNTNGYTLYVNGTAVNS